MRKNKKRFREQKNKSKIIIPSFIEKNHVKTAEDNKATFTETSYHNTCLLEYCYIQWLLGDWENLAKLSQDTLQRHPDRTKLALLVAASKLQLGQITEGRRLVCLAQDWGASSRICAQILISGVYNSLGRVATIICDNNDKALKLFKKSIDLYVPTMAIPALAQNRIDIQLRQLKLSLVIATAEDAQSKERFDTAIRYWQELASLLQDSMPQAYYERLSKAYQAQRGFPLGTKEEEYLTGSIDKHEVLKRFHQKLKPKKYLEIGVQTGKSLFLAECDAIGIDPMPYPNIKLKSNHKIFKMTSDEFFINYAGEYLKKPPDLVFIDGMHLFEFVLRDFINVERYSSINTVVLIDDVFPGHPAQAERVRRTRAWTGDVWKLMVVLNKYRSDLKIKRIDAYPTGVLAISSLSSKNNLLGSIYGKLVEEWKSINTVPIEVIERRGAIAWT